MASLLERSFACSILWAPNITATAVMGSRDHDRGGTPAPQAATSVTSLATAAPRKPAQYFEFMAHNDLQRRKPVEHPTQTATRPFISRTPPISTELMLNPHAFTA